MDVAIYLLGRELSDWVTQLTTFLMTIDAAIRKIYLTAERPDVAAVIEDVYLQ
jgi:hypothetical protein